jgi:hypothetical protein
MELEYVKNAPSLSKNKGKGARLSMLFTAGTTSGFDGLVSTSNHLVPEEDSVFVETSRPIWWVVELRTEGIH